MLQKRLLDAAVLFGLALVSAWPTVAAPINPTFKPDLVATSGSISADGTVTFVVKNQGRLWAAPSSAQVTYGAFAPGGRYQSFVTQVATPSLFVGQSVTLRVKPAPPEYKYCAEAFAIADVTGSIPESVETNNKSATFWGGTYDYSICIN